MDAPQRQAQQPAPGDGRPGIDLDQIGAGVEGGHLRLAAQQVEAVQIVVGDQHPWPACRGLRDARQHLIGRHQVHGAAQQLDSRCGEWPFHAGGGYRIRGGCGMSGSRAIGPARERRRQVDAGLTPQGAGPYVPPP